MSMFSQAVGRVEPKFGVRVCNLFLEIPFLTRRVSLNFSFVDGIEIFLCLTIVIVVAEQSITSYMFECFGIFVRPHCLWPSICFALGKYKGWKSLARLGCCTRKSNLKAGRYWPQSKKIAKVWKLFLNYHPTEEQTVPILDAQSHLFNHGCQSHLLIFHQTSFL